MRNFVNFEALITQARPIKPLKLISEFSPDKYLLFTVKNQLPNLMLKEKKKKQ